MFVHLDESLHIPSQITPTVAYRTHNRTRPSSARLIALRCEISLIVSRQN